MRRREEAKGGRGGCMATGAEPAMAALDQNRVGRRVEADDALQLCSSGCGCCCCCCCLRQQRRELGGGVAAAAAIRRGILVAVRTRSRCRRLVRRQIHLQAAECAVRGRRARVLAYHAAMRARRV
jgi:hypothetical protein